jgi:enoyl-CoA hydratase
VVNRCVPDEELEATVDDWARRIARHPRDALVTGKAVYQMALDSLGGSQQFWRGTVGHTLGTNLRLEPDEFNFLRERNRGGTGAAFSERDDHYEG